MKHVILCWAFLASFTYSFAGVPGIYYHITNRTIVTNVDHKLTRMVIIMPLAQTNEYQTVTNIDLHGGEVIPVPESEDSYIRWTFSGDLPSYNQSREIHYEFDVALKKIQIDFSQIATIFPYDRTSNIYKWYTGKTGPYVDPENSTIRETGDMIWENSDNVLDYARKCYEYVAAGFKYLNPLTGLHPLPVLLSNGGGDCGNLSSIFISLLRYKGIPARHIVTVRPDGSYHVWADFYLEKYGWIPVDVTYKNSDPSGDYFGRYDGNGIVMTRQVWLPVDKGNGEVYSSSILQNYNWWIWFDSGSKFKISHKLTASPYQMAKEMETGQKFAGN